MDFYKITLLALLCVVGIIIVKQIKPEFTVPLSIGASVVILSLICDELYNVVYTFYKFSQSANIDNQAITCVIKVVGIGYLAEFANNVCVDANCKSIGDKVLLASKVAILFCALPIVESLFNSIRNLIV